MTDHQPGCVAVQPGAGQPAVLGRLHPLFATTALTPSRTMLMAAAICWGMAPVSALALPDGATVAAGDAAITRTAPGRLDVIQGSDKAIIDWRSFSIGVGEHTNFQQPSASSITLNRVTGGLPSEILGRLTANGQILLINPNGILFGAGAQVDVASLIATTSDIRNEDFLAGRLHFSIKGNPQASVVNRGAITVREGGLVALVAPGVSNAGIIQARLGRVALAAGNTFTVDLYGDGLIQLALDDRVATGAFAADGVALDSLVANSGEIVADGGSVLLTASAAKGVVDNVINMDGIVEARAVGERNGEIALLGGDAGTVRVAGNLDASGTDAGEAGGRITVTGEQVALAGTAVLDAAGAAGGGTIQVGGAWQGGEGVARADKTVVAQGAELNADATRKGEGGEVVVWADGRTEFKGAISTRGGAEGGDGGKVEVSGKQSLGFAGTVDTRAPQGQTGTLLLDPVNLTVGSGGGDTISSATVVSNMNTTGMVLSADNSITVNEVIDSSAQTNSNTLHFDDADGGGLIANFNAAVTLGNNQQLTGEVTLANVSAGASIQNGIDVAAAGADVNVAAGTYVEQVTINKQGLTLDGTDGARIEVPDDASVDGITVAANDVTVSGFEIAGPVNEPYQTYAWGSNISRGIVVRNGVTGFTIADNDIHDIRTGILIDGRNTGTVTGNRIENTKSGISVQYTDGSGIAIAGNSEGPIGNEWGLIFHLNGHWDGTHHPNPIAPAPDSAWQQALLDFSTNNAGWSVMDLGYTSSNRTHVRVATTGMADNQGSLRTPLDSIQDGIDAVVAGGTVNIANGTYSETLTIDKALTLDGAGIGQTVLQSASHWAGDAVLLDGASDVAISDLTIEDYKYGLRIAGTANDVTVARVSFDDNRYGVAVGTGSSSVAKADRFQMEDATFSGGQIGVQTYNNGANGGSFADAVFDTVSIDGSTVKGFYFETANNLVLRDVTITNTGNVGDDLGRFGHAVDVNLKFADYNAITFENLVVENSGHSSGDATRAAVVVKTRGIPGDSASYTANPASLQSFTVTGGRIEGADGVGISIETLSDGAGGQTEVAIGGGTQFANNGTDIAVNATDVDATGAVFAGAADGFAIEDRVTHALDDSARGTVVWEAGHRYVTTESGSIQRGIDAADAGNIVHVAAGTYGITQQITIDKSVMLSGAQAGVDARSSAGLRTAGSAAESIIDGGGSTGTLLRIEADDVTIDGFELSNGTGDLITSSSGAVIKNPAIRNNIVHGSSGDEGMQIRNSRNAVIEYNRVYDTAGDGINLAGDNVGGVVSSTGGIIRFNEVHDTHSPDGAIYVYGSTDTIIQGNWVYDVNNNDAIKLGDKTGADADKSGGSILDNVVENSIQDGITVYSSDVLVSGNTVRGSQSVNGAIFVDFDVDNVRIENNTIRDSGTSADGAMTYGIRVGKDQNPTGVIVSGNTFENNEAQLFHKNGATELAALLDDNTFERSVTVDGGNAIWSGIQDGVDAATEDGTVMVGAGIYEGGIDIGTQGLDVVGADGAIVNVASGVGLTVANAAFTINSDDVRIAGFEISGPSAAAYTATDWDATQNSYGVSVTANRNGFVIEDNDIRNVRTGINIANNAAGTIVDNLIENTKGAMLVRNDGSTLSITGNRQGTIGNEWGIVLNLGDISTAGAADGARQAVLLGLSTSNNGLSVIDRGYGAANRTHISVDAASMATAADDFDFGNALGNQNQAVARLNDAISGVVTGGFLTVQSGTYSETVSIDRSVNMDVTGGTANIDGLTTAAGTTLGLSGTLAVASAVTMNGNLVLRDHVVLDTSAANASMTFTGAIDGTTSEAQDLALDAGSGMVMAENIGQSMALRDMTVTAGSYDASTGTTDLHSLTVSGDDISVGNHTVNASGTVSLQGKNISGSVNATNVNLQGSGNVTTTVVATNQVTVTGNNVTGSVSGGTVTIQATQTANTTVNATNHVNVSAQTVTGSISAPTANVTATETIQVVANVNDLTAQAPTGNITGSVDNVTVVGGMFDFNGQAAAPLPSGVGRDQAYLDPGAAGAPDAGARAADGLAGDAFGGGFGQNVFEASFSLGIAPDSVTPAAGGDGEAKDGDADNGRDDEEADFLDDFWGYYFSSSHNAGEGSGQD